MFNIAERLFERKINSIVDHRVSCITEASESEDGNMIFEVSNGKVGFVKDFERKLLRKRITAKDIKTKSSNTRRNFKNMSMLRSPYNYEKIDRYFSKESYFSRSVARQYETMLRNGYEFYSTNMKYVRIIKENIDNIEKNNLGSLDQTFARIHKDLSLYGICIIHNMHVANNDRKFGGKATRDLQRLRIIRPHKVTAYFDDKDNFLGIDENKTTTINFGNLRNKIKTRNTSSNRSPEIPAADLIILRIYQDDDVFFPEPTCFQMLDDILTLRSIEETIELLIYQYGSPILHGKVGTDEDPARTGEVGDVRSNLEAMASNGLIVTDHRIQLTAINLLKNVGDFTSVLEYFKTRILVGTGSSNVSVGEGDTANRSTAESIDDALADHCMYFANIICFMMNSYVIPFILINNVESLDSVCDETGDPLVMMLFNEMRLDKQIQIHNSATNLYHGNILPHNRILKMLKQHPIQPDEEKELFANKVTIPLAKVGKANQANNETESTSKSTKSANQPANQYGTKAGPGSKKN